MKRAMSEAQVSRAVLPQGVTAPRPVMTTRREVVLWDMREEKN